MYVYIKDVHIIPNFSSNSKSIFHREYFLHKIVKISKVSHSFIILVVVRKKNEKMV